MKFISRLSIYLIFAILSSCSELTDSEKSKKEEEKKAGNLSKEKIETYINNAAEKIINATAYLKPEKYNVKTLNVEYIKDYL